MTKREAWLEGEAAVRRKPPHAPDNPYDADEESELHQAWDDGATSAGINDIYYNGELRRSEQ